MPRRPDVPCAGDCGKLLWRGKGCLPSGEAMCRACRAVRFSKTRDAVCAYCLQPFRSVRHKGRWTECCSPLCATKRRVREVLPTTPEESHARQERQRARWRAKNHRRRTQYRAAFDQVTPEHEFAIRAKAKRCPLCKVRMTDTPYLSNSKELDHIVPRNVGGTHTVGNVRIICRLCNVRRPGDGSDYTGPVTLWAEVPA